MGEGREREGTLVSQATVSTVVLNLETIIDIYCFHSLPLRFLDLPASSLGSSLV